MIIKTEEKSPDGVQANRDDVTAEKKSQSLFDNRAANDNAQVLSSGRATDLPPKTDEAVDNNAGKGFSFLKLPDPWEDEVTLGEVLRNIADLLDAYLHLPNHAPNLLALWAGMTWIHGGIKDYAPYLFFTAATKGAGKITAT